MRIFKITKEIEIVCNSISTSYGFKHLATLFRDGSEIQDGKCTYQNRTWERYEFQSVLNDVVRKAFKNKLISEEEKKACDEFIEGDQTDWSDFKAVSMVAKLGEVLCDNQKDKNDWKERMIKAGFENKGLIMPDDWNELDEDTKQKRLNGVLEVISNAPQGDKE